MTSSTETHTVTEWYVFFNKTADGLSHRCDDPGFDDIVEEEVRNLSLDMLIAVTQSALSNTARAIARKRTLDVERRAQEEARRKGREAREREEAKRKKEQKKRDEEEKARRAENAEEYARQRAEADRAWLEEYCLPGCSCEHDSQARRKCKCRYCVNYRRDIEREKDLEFGETFTIIKGVLDQFVETLEMKWTEELLESGLAMPDGTRTTWGEATLEQHFLRRDMLLKNANANFQSAARHQKAINDLNTKGCNSLNELVHEEAA